MCLSVLLSCPTDIHAVGDGFPVPAVSVLLFLPFFGEFVGIYGAGRETRPLQCCLERCDKLQFFDLLNQADKHIPLYHNLAFSRLFLIAIFVILKNL